MSIAVTYAAPLHLPVCEQFLGTSAREVKWLWPGATHSVFTMTATCQMSIDRALKNSPSDKNSPPDEAKANKYVLGVRYGE